LIEPATAGEADVMRLLVDRGADVRKAAQPALTMAITMRCSRCVYLLLAKEIDRAAYTGALADVAVLGDLNAVRLMLDRGADVNALDPFGRTPLMYAAASDLLPLELVQLPIDKGADVNAKSRHAEAGMPD
jgi:hypothetical protein